MSTHRSNYRPGVAVGMITLAAPIPSQLEENGLQAMLDELPGVRAVEFPRQDGIEVKYDAGLVGERQLSGAVRLAGYVLLEFAPQAVK